MDLDSSPASGTFFTEFDVLIFASRELQIVGPSAQWIDYNIVEQKLKMVPNSKKLGNTALYPTYLKGY